MQETQETWVQTLGWEDPLGEGTPVFLPEKSHEQRSLVGYIQATTHEVIKSWT